jgi:hypothetical protein
MRNAFDAILPSEITDAAARAGNEWVLPLPQAKVAVDLATKHLISILGVESFRIQQKGVSHAGLHRVCLRVPGRLAELFNKTTKRPCPSLRRIRLVKVTIYYDDKFGVGV